MVETVKVAAVCVCVCVEGGGELEVGWEVGICEMGKQAVWEMSTYENNIQILQIV